MKAREKNTVIMLESYVQTLDVYLKKDDRRIKEVATELKYARTYLNKAAQRMIAGLLEDYDHKEIDKLLKYLNNIECVIRPRSVMDQPYLFVAADVLYRLLGDCYSDCGLCEKNAADAARCQRRKDLDHIGYSIRTTGKDCPYQL